MKPNITHLRFKRTATWNLATSRPCYRRPWWDIRRWFWLFGESKW